MGLWLDLGSGANPREGYEGVDMYAEAQHRVNLMRFPWPWSDGSCERLFCSHFIEHIPTCYVSPDNVYRPVPEGPEDLDLLVRFFDECHRVLETGGTLELVWPALQSVRAFQDPTHRRYIPMETMHYFNPSWRDANNLGHYLGRASFEIAGTNFAPSSLLQQQGALAHPEAIGQALLRNWNLIGDFQVTLRAL
jgi:predicted SAM-dependent methyltransferase